MRLDLTRRADYAIRAVLALGRLPDGDRISVRRVAAAQRIPAPFLPPIMRDLVLAGVAGSTTGRAGGYRLARPAAEVSLLDIIEAVEGDSRRGTCILRDGPCTVSAVCDVHDVVVAAQEALRDRLAQVSVADLTRPRT